MKRITVITGTRGCGKTAIVREIARTTPDALGVIAEKCLEADATVSGYDVRLIPCGKIIPLCRRRQDATFTQPHGRFWFDMTVFDLIRDYIIENFSPNKLVILDEVGTLETVHHQGHYQLLQWLIAQPELTAVITMRGE